mmetsp:Transcript_10193/g.37486  ORF Transcript_10193/g.37486 Transcript_10193/m.37486 type:complete len:335 (+) Transcript_10193:725-1729(+)
MPFDYEARQAELLAAKDRLKIGIVGFGNFGQFLAKRFLQQHHTVIATSRRDYRQEAEALGVEYYADSDDFCEQHPDVVVLCSSIVSTRKVLDSLNVQRLRRNTLFVDVLSVKAFPKQLMLQQLPPYFDILCTHPMFGPESGKDSWDNLRFVYDKVRVGDSETRRARCERFLRIFEREGCAMVEMSCEEHDRFAASSQFITHTVGRMLGRMELDSTPINTKGYDTLLDLIDNTAGDSFDLYYGLFMYNVNATEELDRMERAFDAVKKQLLDQLHDVAREQLLGSTSASAQEQEPPRRDGARTLPPLRPRGANGGAPADSDAERRGGTNDFSELNP